MIETERRLFRDAPPSSALFFPFLLHLGARALRFPVRIFGSFAANYEDKV